MSRFSFEIIRAQSSQLMRAGVMETEHGRIETPAFVPVATKATVKAVSPEELGGVGAQILIANTYHLHIAPGEKAVAAGGGVAKFMGWQGPNMTDSGGFQVFSLGAAWGKGVSKVASLNQPEPMLQSRFGDDAEPKIASIDQYGVMFRSHLDGSAHYFTPEKSIEIQHALGADIIFAFDECTSPHEPIHYQKEALERTHRWAKRSLAHHKTKGGQNQQAIFGVVQGGREKSLRQESARAIGAMDFDGFGIGGSFVKEDMESAVRWVNEILPPHKPRHLLGIGEPEDIFMAVENGCDTFDCVAPTRMGRHGQAYTRFGKLNLLSAECVGKMGPIDGECDCYTCRNFTVAYLSHLFRAKEMLAATLASIHNLRFIIKLTADIRQSILDGNFLELKQSFLSRYVF